MGDVRLADVKLSSLSLSADSIVSTFNKVIDEVNSKGGGDFLPLSGGTLTGAVSSTSDVTLDGVLKVNNDVTAKSLTVGKVEIATKVRDGSDPLVPSVEVYSQVDVGGNISATGSLDVDGTVQVGDKIRLETMTRAEDGSLI